MLDDVGWFLQFDTFKPMIEKVLLLGAFTFQRGSPRHHHIAALIKPASAAPCHTGKRTMPPCNRPDLLEDVAAQLRVLG